MYSTVQYMNKHIDIDIDPDVLVLVLVLGDWHNWQMKGKLDAKISNDGARGSGRERDRGALERSLSGWLNDMRHDMVLLVQ